jgi:hypothetical protein
VEVPAPNALTFFLKQTEKLNLKEHGNWLPLFLQLDDVDVMAAIKQWAFHKDHVLKELCNRLIYRRLLKTKELPSSLSEEKRDAYQRQLAESMGWTIEETRYLFFERSLTNTAYNPESEMIKILFKDGELRDISEAATIFRFSALASQETKNYLYFPENMTLG